MDESLEFSCGCTDVKMPGDERGVGSPYHNLMSTETPAKQWRGSIPTEQKIGVNKPQVLPQVEAPKNLLRIVRAGEISPYDRYSVRPGVDFPIQVRQTGSGCREVNCNEDPQTPDDALR